MVMNLSAMQETGVRSLGWADPLEKGMDTHSSILAWEIPWTEGPGGLQSRGSKRTRHNWTTNTLTLTLCGPQIFLYLKLNLFYFADKGPDSQSYGFSSNHVWMWELGYKESWAPKNWCFWTVVLEKTARRSNQSILKEISPEYSLEGLMLKLKLQYFGHLMQRTDSPEKTLMLGKI